MSLLRYFAAPVSLTFRVGILKGLIDFTMIMEEEAPANFSREMPGQDFFFFEIR